MTQPGVIVSGAILTGGASRRMGRTKALVEIDGMPMASLVCQALRDVRCEEIFLVGGDPDELSALDLTVVADRHPGEGPVGGVITALHHASTDAVLVVACDLPFLTDDTMRRLLARAGSAHVVVARTDRIQPTIALWPRSALADIERAFASGTRSMHRLLDEFDLCEVPVDPAEVVNVNSPEDF